MDAPRILIATATYNEANNVRELVSRIRATLGDTQQILIIDDNSPDGTSTIVRDIMATDPCLNLITRRYKLGLGSAHKLMKQYAMANVYTLLVTMDADLSHRPEEIPSLVERAGENIFVIGSRYLTGGKCDYVGFRKSVSLLGNALTRNLLGIKLNEFTTSFRVFDVSLLARSPLSQIKSNGYSYFVEIVSMMEELGANIVEVPIHFKDRLNDVSKIPKSQAVKSLLHLCALSIRRRLKRLKPVSPVMTYSRCRICGEKALLPFWSEGVTAHNDVLSAQNYSCSGIQFESEVPLLHECLSCGVVQIVTSCNSLVHNFYCDTDDESYLANFSVKLRTFRRAYSKLAPFLPQKKLNILDIGSYYGAFLEVAKARGHSVYGVEPSKSAAEYSQNVLGHTVVNELFSRNSYFPGIKFDVITSWDVIEHLEDPTAFLNDTSSLLSKDGIFVCSTVIIDSLIARVLKKRWHWVLPMHLTYFKNKEFTDLLHRHGFEVLANYNHTHYASLSYAIKGAVKNKGIFLNKVGAFLSGRVPDSIVLPFALGDVQMFVCRKM